MRTCFLSSLEHYCFLGLLNKQALCLIWIWLTYECSHPSREVVTESCWSFLRFLFFDCLHLNLHISISRKLWNATLEEYVPKAQRQFVLFQRFFGLVWLCLFLKSTLYAKSAIERKKRILAPKIYSFLMLKLWLWTSDAAETDLEKTRKNKKSFSNLWTINVVFPSETEYFFENVYLKFHKFWAVTTHSKCHSIVVYPCINLCDTDIIINVINYNYNLVCVNLPVYESTYLGLSAYDYISRTIIILTNVHKPCNHWL